MFVCLFLSLLSFPLLSSAYISDFSCTCTRAIRGLGSCGSRSIHVHVEYTVPTLCFLSFLLLGSADSATLAFRAIFKHEVQHSVMQACAIQSGVHEPLKAVKQCVLHTLQLQY